MKLKPGTKKMVLIAYAQSEQQREITVGALWSAGIWSHVVDSGVHYPLAVGGIEGGRYEIWVPARDEERAREILGL
ncbi:MAG TPA: hypothetical protein VGR43_03685 [Dehalococcoidia bacterium]|nr:hypothetical protein [Dehalococcoidia bacterium]